MAQDFYPFVDNGGNERQDVTQVRHPARIAVYDDPSAAPRVVVVEPKDVRDYLEEITLQVTQLSASQGGTIPFMVIREIVENLIHAYFMEPTVSILDHGNTIRFSDQGPGIAQKELALQYGTTSATEEMRHYIRGVGSGLPYVHQYMRDKGGSLLIEDNIAGGTVVTLSTQPASRPPQIAPSPWQQAPGAQMQQMGWPVTQGAPQGAAQPMGNAQPWPTQSYQQAWAPPQQGWQGAQGWPTTQSQQSPWPPQPTQDTAWPQAPTQSTAPVFAPTPAPAQQQWPQISVRGRAVLEYLSQYGSVGPSDLARAYGESQPTWTRELQALEEAGLVRKDGQKRRLTAMGQAFVSGGA